VLPSGADMRAEPDHVVGDGEREVELDLDRPGVEAQALAVVARRPVDAPAGGRVDERLEQRDAIARDLRPRIARGADALDLAVELWTGEMRAHVAAATDTIAILVVLRVDARGAAARVVAGVEPDTSATSEQENERAHGAMECGPATRRRLRARPSSPARSG